MNNNKTEIAKSDKMPGNKYLLLTLLIYALTSLISYANASDNTKTKAAISYGALKKNLNSQIRSTFIEQAAEIKFSAKTSAKSLSPTTLDENKLSANKANFDFSTDFTIYSAVTFLENDFDADGYYQTFSVIFDADLYSYTTNEIREVYALLYLSLDGGPWTHYYTTDNFIIEGDSDADEYEVLTTLLSGYPPGHYDVLIDLYQVGYEGIVASYSADDSNALYALPLESADFDEPYVETIEIIHGGGISITVLLLLSSILIVRFTGRFST